MSNATAPPAAFNLAAHLITLEATEGEPALIAEIETPGGLRTLA